jgi:hypothetical protein
MNLQLECARLQMYSKLIKVYRNLLTVVGNVSGGLRAGRGASFLSIHRTRFDITFTTITNNEFNTFHRSQDSAFEPALTL